MHNRQIRMVFKNLHVNAQSATLVEQKVGDLFGTWNNRLLDFFTQMNFKRHLETTAELMYRFWPTVEASDETHPKLQHLVY